MSTLLNCATPRALLSQRKLDVARFPPPFGTSDLEFATSPALVAHPSSNLQHLTHSWHINSILEPLSHFGFIRTHFLHLGTLDLMFVTLADFLAAGAVCFGSLGKDLSGERRGWPGRPVGDWPGRKVGAALRRCEVCSQSKLVESRIRNMQKKLPQRLRS